MKIAEVSEKFGLSVDTLAPKVCVAESIKYSDTA
jgi:hypothetical protein